MDGAVVLYEPYNLKRAQEVIFISGVYLHRDGSGSSLTSKWPQVEVKQQDRHLPQMTLCSCAIFYS